MWYPRSPALKPPTPLQIHWRNKFRIAGYVWRRLLPRFRDNWLATQARAHLNITGYNLFTYFILTNDEAAIHTIEHQTGLDLIPFEEMAE